MFRPEQILQQQVASYLHLAAPSLIWWHTPNGGARSKAEAAILKSMGVRAGVADLAFILTGARIVQGLGGAALMCLVHAPALLALAMAGQRLRLAGLSGALLILGVLLFAGDLVKRHYSGTGLFPMSAPSGGMIMMAGWLAAGLGALVSAQPSTTER